MVTDPEQSALFVDASTIFAFLRLNRMDLLAGCRMVDHIENDVRRIASPKIRASFERAVDEKIIRIYSVTDLLDMRAANDLYDKHGLGKGEAFSCVAVLREKARLVVDALATIKRINACSPSVPISTIHEFIAHRRDKGLLAKEEAVNIVRMWN